MKSWIIPVASLIFVTAHAQIQKSPLPSESKSDSAKQEGSFVMMQPKKNRSLINLTGSYFQFESEDKTLKYNQKSLSLEGSYGITENLSVGAGTSLSKSESEYNWSSARFTGTSSGFSEPLIFGRHRANLTDNSKVISTLSAKIPTGPSQCSANDCNGKEGGGSGTLMLALENQGSMITGFAVAGTLKDLRKSSNESSSGTSERNETGGNTIGLSTYVESAISNKFRVGADLSYMHTASSESTTRGSSNYTGRSPHNDFGTLSVWGLSSVNENFQVKPGVSYWRPLGTGKDSDGDIFMFNVSGVIGI